MASLESASPLQCLFLKSLSAAMGERERERYTTDWWMMPRWLPRNGGRREGGFASHRVQEYRRHKYRTSVWLFPFWDHLKPKIVIWSLHFRTDLRNNSTYCLCRYFRVPRPFFDSLVGFTWNVHFFVVRGGPKMPFGRIMRPPTTHEHFIIKPLPVYM